MHKEIREKEEELRKMLQSDSEKLMLTRIDSIIDKTSNIITKFEEEK